MGLDVNDSVDHAVAGWLVETMHKWSPRQRLRRATHFLIHLFEGRRCCRVDGVIVVEFSHACGLMVKFEGKIVGVDGVIEG